MIRTCKIDRALAVLNRANGCTSVLQPGHLYYADVRGDGVRRLRTIWCVISRQGGVTRSNLNRRSPRATLAAIQHATKSNPL